MAVKIPLARAVAKAQELMARPLVAGFNALEGLGEARTVLSADPVASTLIGALTRNEIGVEEFVRLIARRTEPAIALTRRLFDVDAQPEWDLREIVRKQTAVEVGPRLATEIAALYEGDRPAWPSIPIGPLGGGIVLETGGIGVVPFAYDLLSPGIAAFPLSAPTMGIYGKKAGSRVDVPAIRPYPMSIYPPRDWTDVGRYLDELIKHKPFPSLGRIFQGLRYGERPNTVEIRLLDEKGRRVLQFEVAAEHRDLLSHVVTDIQYEPERGRRRLRMTAGVYSQSQGDVRFYRAWKDDYLPRDLPVPHPADHVAGTELSATGWLHQRPVVADGNGRVSGRADPRYESIAIMAGTLLVFRGFDGEMQGLPHRQIGQAVRAILAGGQPADDSVVVTIDPRVTGGAPWGAWVRGGSGETPLYVSPIPLEPSYDLAMAHARHVLEAGYEIQRGGGRVAGTPIYGAGGVPVSVTMSMGPRTRSAAGAPTAAGGGAAAGGGVPEDDLPQLEPLGEGGEDLSGPYRLRGDQVVQDDLALRIRPSRR